MCYSEQNSELYKTEIDGLIGSDQAILYCSEKFLSSLNDQ